MREILFCGKRIDNGEWVEGFLILKNGRAGIVRLRVPELTKETADEFIKGYRCFDVIPETVGQYTGLTDKNGKKIFEGDIVRSIIDYDDIWGDSRTVVDVGTVIWNETNCEWSVENEIDTTSLCEWDEGDFTVIGNIHDNPELLDGGDNGEKV